MFNLRADALNRDTIKKDAHHVLKVYCIAKVGNNVLSDHIKDIGANTNAKAKMVIKKNNTILFIVIIFYTGLLNNQLVL